MLHELSRRALLNGRSVPEKDERNLQHRLWIAKELYNVWTGNGSCEGALAERYLDGSIYALEDFVHEAGASKDCHREEVDAHAMSSIDRVHVNDLACEEFMAKYLKPNKPVLIQGTSAHWLASKEWVHKDGSINIKAMATMFHAAHVTATSTSGSSSGYGAGKRVHMKFHEFCKLWESDSHESRELYLKDWHFASEFPDYKMLMESLCQSTDPVFDKAYECPHFFTDDWLNDYYDLRRRHPTHRSQHTKQEQDIATSDYRFVYLGRKGTWTPVHADVLRSYSWSTNVAGRKRWKLLPPQHTLLLMDRFGREMAPSFDLEDPGCRFPNLAQAAALAIEIEQGTDEALFVPSGWHHSVHNIEDTLSINHNWLNGFNLHWSWDLLCQEHADATMAIEDCRGLCTAQEFEDLVQRNMEANCSFNFISMSHFIGTVALRQMRRLCSSPGDTHEGFSLQQCLLTLQAILDKLQESYKLVIPQLALGTTDTEAVQICSAQWSGMQDSLDKALTGHADKKDVAETIARLLSAGRSTLLGC